MIHLDSSAKLLLSFINDNIALFLQSKVVNSMITLIV